MDHRRRYRIRRLVQSCLAAVVVQVELLTPASADPAPAENGYYWIYNYPGMPGHEWAVARWDAEFGIWIVPDDEPFEHDNGMTVGPRLLAPNP